MLSTLWVKENPEDCLYRPSPKSGLGLLRLPEGDLPEMASLYTALEAKSRDQSSFRFLWRNESWRVEASPSITGQRIYVLRHLMKRIPSMEDIGVPRNVREKLMEANLRGLILVVGLQGSGKTTFAASLISDRVKAFGGNVATIEDPPEIDLDGLYSNGETVGQITQIDVKSYEHLPPNARTGEAIAGCFRSDTDLLFFGEVRRPAEASELIKSVSGIGLCLTTLHASTPDGALERLSLLMGGGTDTLSVLAEAITAVIYLKLESVRTNNGSNLKRLRVMPLFFNGPGPRSIVREGRFRDLRSEIERQINKMLSENG